MSSIQIYINELKALESEIKRQSAYLKKLRNNAKEVNAKIIDYFKTKQQPGAKYKGYVITIEEKEKRGSKKKHDRYADAIDVLEQYGVSHPKKVLKKILEARRGEIEIKKYVKIKKYKK